MSVTRVRCQRIGCDAMFMPEENEDDSACIYHPGPPLFHDGGKEWACCKQRSHDFSLFLELPGCKKGKHTTEKPVLPSKARPAPKPVAAPVSKEACSRCKQGFFCADHGTPGKPLATTYSSRVSVSTPVQVPTPAAAPPKILDLDAKQQCKHHGCGITFTERENHDTSCHYHPGPPVFHDRSRGWACCDVHVKEFDEFMSIPPCAKGWHT